MIVICFISQWMKRSKHSLSVFPLKKTLICRGHCSISQSCCSMMSEAKYRLISIAMRVCIRSIDQTNSSFPVRLLFLFCLFQGHTPNCPKVLSSKVLLGLLLLTLFQERLSKKVHATITKVIVGGFDCTVLQRNLKEWHIPWVPEAFFAYGGNFRCWPKADTWSFRAGHYKDLTETGNRARKISGTQGKWRTGISSYVCEYKG